MATNKEMKTEFAYFGEAWTLFKKYYDVREDNNYWDSMFDESITIMKKYDCPLCDAIIRAIIEELERKYQAKKEKKIS